MGSVNVIGNQIDVGSIVSQLMELERQPVVMLEKQISSLKNKSAAYQVFNTKLSALGSAVNKILYGSTSAPLVSFGSLSDRMSKSVFTSRAATSSNENTVSATASGTISNGSYSIAVSQLAQAKTSVSKGYATVTEDIGPFTGNITIGDKSVDIDFTAGTLKDLQKDLQKKINEAKIGVNASIINDGTNYRLMLTSTETGIANGFMIAGTMAIEMDFEARQNAQDAMLTINGIDITSSSNTVKDAIEGVTLNLKNTTTGSETIKIDVAVNNDAIVSAISEMISAYNEVNAYIASQFAYNDKGGTGVLSGDSTLRSVQSRLQSAITLGMPAGYNNGYLALGNVGISFNRDGSLALDESKLKDALSKDLDAVTNFFIGYEVPGIDPDKPQRVGGVMTGMGEALKGLTDPLVNPIKNAMDGINRSISDIEKNIAAYEIRLQAREDMLYAQWTAADQALRLMQVALSSINSSLSSLTGNNNTGNNK